MRAMKDTMSSMVVAMWKSVGRSQPPRRREYNVRSPKLASLLPLVLAAACSGGEDGNSAPPPPQLETVLPLVATEGGAVAVRKTTALPTAAAGPDASAANTSAILPGGSAFFTLSAPSAFDTIYVGVDASPGYWEISVAAGTSETLVLSVGQRAPQTFTLVFGVASGGVAGDFARVPVTLTSVGTGPIQVSLTWDAEADVDLHVEEPNGTDIYYGNDVSASGGRLDLDSNAGCSIDGVNNENITYASGTPQRGTYVVRVDYWDSCSVAQSKYVVTVNVNGAVKTYSGTLTGSGDQGGAHSGVQVATFTY